MPWGVPYPTPGHRPTRRDPFAPVHSSLSPAVPKARQRYSAFVHDAARKSLFSHPRMVEDLLRGFVAAGWSDALDLSTLQKLPAEFVSDDLRQRRGDTLWRVRVRDGTWIYLVVLLEFQSTVDRYMAVRMLVYTGLLYQGLILRGGPGPGRELPPVLPPGAAPGAAPRCCPPVVLYNGPTRWTAATDVARLIAPVSQTLEPYQPSQRYFVPDEGACGDDDLPRRNLVSALIDLENSQSSAGMERTVGMLIDWFRGSGQPELKRAFEEWISRVLMPRRSGTEGPAPVLQLEEVRTMLAERVKEWTRPWFEAGIERGIEQGIERGIEQGRTEERRLLCRLAARKFGGETAERLSSLLDGLTAPEPLAEVGDWIIECDTGEDLLDRTERMIQRS